MATPVSREAAPDMTPELPKEADIAIVGGGPAGASLALMLASACRANARRNWRILLLEAPHSTALAIEPAAEHADVMAIALSESSRQIYLHAGVWPLLREHAAPITDIQVSHRGHLGSAHFSAAEQGLVAYGQVIENHRLGAALNSALASAPGVSRVAARATRLLPRRNGMTVEAGRQSCTVQLVVVADGAQSPLRAGLGIGARTKHYGQSAVIATLSLADDPGGRAWERFTDDGPVALLPLPAVAGSPRAGLVWTLPPQRAATLAAADPEQFLAALRDAFGDRAGPITGCGPRSVRPLQRVLADEQVRRHLVLLGNAAHSLHPVAGQGFNLSLRDAATLTASLIEAADSGQALGELAVLQRYLALQQADQARTIQFSDRLPALFAGHHGLPGRLLAEAANLGLIALDLLPPLRAGFTRLGAGLLTREARFHG
ncbi:MAG: FAD-dependent monooxygenase [Porticoccaceae bacterium]